MGNKAFKTNWNQIFESDNSEYCVSLTRPMANALISQLEYLRWQTRWENIPSMDAVKAFVDDIEKRLITVSVDCGYDMSCEDVADCIDDNETTRTAVQNVVNNTYQQSTPTRITTGTLATYNAENEPANACNDDNLFAMATALVDALHGDALDFFEAFEVATNVVEAVNVVGSYLGVEILTADTVATITQGFNYLQENFFENYIAQYTDEKRDELRCALFCYARAQCSFSAADYLIAITGIPSSILAIVDDVSVDYAEIIDFFLDVADGSYDGIDVVKVCHAVLILLAFSFDVGFDANAGLRYNQMARYRTQVLVAADEVNNDWTLLCEDCDCIGFTMTHSMVGGNVSFPAPLVVTNGAYSATYDDWSLIAGGSIEVLLDWTFEECRNITYMRIDRWFNPTQLSSTEVSYNGGEFIASSNASPSTIPTPFEWSGSINGVTSLRIRLTGTAGVAYVGWRYVEIG